MMKRKDDIYRIYLGFNGAIVAVETNEKAYCDYVRFYFKQIEVVPASPAVQVAIRILWQGKRLWEQDFKRARDVYDGVGSNTLLGNREVRFVRKLRQKIVFEMKKEPNDGLFFRAVMSKNALRDFFLYDIIRKGRETLFFELTYHFLYYPIFWYWENIQKRHLLHASAVVLKERGILLCGLEGVGKSSLALALLDSDDAIFVSDNLVCYDKKKLYSCYELLRLHADGEQNLWGRHFEKINTFKTTKDYFVPKQKTIADGVPVNLVLFPQFGSRFSVDEISSDMAVCRAVRLSFASRELEQYQPYANMYQMMDMNVDIENQRLKTLESILRGVPCYVVTMPKKDGLAENIKRVKTLVSQVLP